MADEQNEFAVAVEALDGGHQKWTMKDSESTL